MLTSFYIYTANIVMELLILVKTTGQHLNPLKHEERETENRMWKEGVVRDIMFGWVIKKNSAFKA